VNVGDQVVLSRPDWQSLEADFKIGDRGTVTQISITGIIQVKIGIHSRTYNFYPFELDVIEVPYRRIKPVS
jgi:hypothetical protein